MAARGVRGLRQRAGEELNVIRPDIATRLNHQFFSSSVISRQGCSGSIMECPSATAIAPSRLSEVTKWSSDWTAHMAAAEASWIASRVLILWDGAYRDSNSSACWKCQPETEMTRNLLCAISVRNRLSRP